MKEPGEMGSISLLIVVVAYIYDIRILLISKEVTVLYVFLLICILGFTVIFGYVAFVFLKNRWEKKIWSGEGIIFRWFGRGKYLKIPENIETIKASQFEGDQNLVSVIIPGTVRKIGDGAFAECKNLKRVVLQEGIESIGLSVFTGCYKLRKVTVPDSVITCWGESFHDTRLKEPVLNASGTILFFCPESVSGREWRVPDTVKIISQQAFIKNRKLEVLHLPEGLETIKRLAFIYCPFQKITIPKSVREIEDNAFWHCENLEEVRVLNPLTQVGSRAFVGCGRLARICWEGWTGTDALFHQKGQPFLVQHLEDSANLAHRGDPEFSRLTKLCAEGKADAMEALSEWFEQCSTKPGASPFYARAANYWRYRAYQKEDPEAVAWFDRFFLAHPGERLESILPEDSDARKGFYSFEVSGSLLNELGYGFFDPARYYEIKKDAGEDLVVASSFDSYDSPDEDGFGAEYSYAWWFLDENMQPLLGIRPIIATVRETSFPFFREARAQAIQVLEQRKEHREADIPSCTVPLSDQAGGDGFYGQADGDHSG